MTNAGKNRLVKVIFTKHSQNKCYIDQIRVETCTDPCGLNRSDEAASTAADDDQIRVETCTDPCGLNWSVEAANTAADDDQISDTCANSFGRYIMIVQCSRNVFTFY